MENDKAAMLRRVNKANKEFAKKATALSALLREVEDTLQDIEGKLAVDHDIDEKHNLSFERSSTSGWELCISEYVGSQRTQYVATEARIDLKAVAALGIPALVEAITEIQEQRISAIDEGLESLAEIEWLDVEAALSNQDDDESDNAESAEDLF